MIEIVKALFMFHSWTVWPHWGIFGKIGKKVIGLLVLDVCGGSVVSVSLDKYIGQSLLDQGGEEYLSRYENSDPVKILNISQQQDLYQSLNKSVSD